MSVIDLTPQSATEPSEPIEAAAAAPAEEAPPPNTIAEESTEKSQDDPDKDFFLEALKEKEEAKRYREEMAEVAKLLSEVKNSRDLTRLVEAGLIDEDALVDASASVIKARLEKESMSEEQKQELAYKKSLEEKAKKAEELERRIMEFERKEAEMKYMAQLEKDVPEALAAAGLPTTDEYTYNLLDIIDKAIDTLDTVLTPSQAAKVLKHAVAQRETKHWSQYEALDEDTLYERIPQTVREKLRKAEVARATRKADTKQGLTTSPQEDNIDESKLTWEEKVSLRAKRLLG